MRISDEIEFLSIYFVVGDTPKEWTRNAIKDPPSGGWSNAFVIRNEGFLPKVFIPYTLQSWSVPKECYELERTREVLKPVDGPWMLDCLIRNEVTYGKLPGANLDRAAAAQVIEALGFEVPPQFLPEDAVPTKKERKAKEKQPRVDKREGLVSVATIAQELGIIPRVARGYLRAAKIDKPAVGWAGDQAWADMIREALKAEMSKEKPVKVKPAPKAKPEPAKKVKAKKAAPKPAKKAAAPKGVKVEMLGKPSKGRTFPASTPEQIKAAGKAMKKAPAKKQPAKKKGKKSK